MKRKIVRTSLIYILLLSIILLVNRIYGGPDPLVALLSWFLPGLFMLACFFRLLVLRLWKGRDKAPASLLLVHALALLAWFLIGFIPS